MLSAENFTPEHIYKIKENEKIDPSILERSIYALGLLEALTRVGLPFIFKGGTSLMLLLKKPKRLSTDIDIVVSPNTDVKDYLHKASKIYPFKSVREDIRKIHGKIIKSHYRFSFYSKRSEAELEILLDILFEENHYNNLIERRIETELVVTEEPYLMVCMPSADCLLGDKLTAFAPHTTGVPINANKDIEIIKQMFDIATLTAELDNFADVYRTYMKTVKAELFYRGLNIGPEEVLEDTINAAICIASRGNVNPEDYNRYKEGIKGLKTHVYGVPFNGERAAEMACQVIYIAACILTNTEPKKIMSCEEHNSYNIGNTDFSKLSYLKKIRPYSFAFVVESAKLMKKYRDGKDTGNQ